MNPIKRITSLPNLPWLDHSAGEIAMTGADLAEHSDFCYQIGDIIAVGFIYSSYLEPPWMWFALAEGITISDLIDFRRLSREIPPGTLTGILADYTLGVRFAELYGFEDTGDTRETSGKLYKIFRRK